MKITKEARRVSRELFQASLINGRLNDERVRTIANHIVKTKPRQYFNILSAFERLVRLELSRRHAVVDSAIAWTDESRAEMEASLRGKYGPDITIEYRVLPELIGGLRIRMGSDVYDSTVRERLNRLEAATLDA